MNKSITSKFIKNLAILKEKQSKRSSKDQWWGLGLWLQFTNKMLIFPNKVTKITITLKKVCRIGAIWKWYESVFLIHMALCIMNMHQKFQQMPKSTTWKFNVNFAQLCLKNSQTFSSFFSSLAFSWGLWGQQLRIKLHA